MRWPISSIRCGWEMGKIRKRSGFLFLPKTIGKETRWLEFATWEEEGCSNAGMPYGGWYWKPIRWIDKEDS